MKKLERRALLKELVGLGLKPRASRVGCQGFCKQGCVVFVEQPRPRIWGRVGSGDVARLARKLAKSVRKRAR